MKKRILHDLKVIFLTLFVTAIVLLIALFIWDYIDGYRYYTVHKVGSIELNYEFDHESSRYNFTKDDVLQYLERYYDYIQDEEDYQKLYQKVEDQDENTIFVMSLGAPIRYIRYYHGDDIGCTTVFGKLQPCRIYIYRVNRGIPAVG